MYPFATMHPHATVAEDSWSWERHVRSLERLIGNTPLLELRCRVRGELRTVYAKIRFIRAPNSYPKF